MRLAARSSRSFTAPTPPAKRKSTSRACSASATARDVPEVISRGGSSEDVCEVRDCAPRQTAGASNSRRHVRSESVGEGPRGGDHGRAEARVPTSQRNAVSRSEHRLTRVVDADVAIRDNRPAWLELPVILRRQSTNKRRPAST